MNVGQIRQFHESRIIIKVTGVVAEPKKPLVVKYLYLSGPGVGNTFELAADDLEKLTMEMVIA